MTVALAGEALAGRVGQAVPGAVLAADDASVSLRAEYLPAACRFLKEEQGLEFDFLESISGVDYIDHFEVAYHLLSLRHNHSLVLKVPLRGREGLTAPSITAVWPAADLQEREVYDLMGITFEDHPNMKRILLWDGFEGHPLRKDYL